MNCGGLQTATHRCMVCSSSNLVSGGHGDMALNQQKHAAPRQWHGKGSEGQVPTQHQHAAPYMYDGPSTLGVRQYKENSTTRSPCAPHHEVSVKGLEHLGLHEGSVHRNGRSLKKRFGAPTQPSVAQKPQDGRWELCFQMQKAMP